MKEIILVTGGTSGVGIELQKKLPEATYVSSKDYDLRCEQEVVRMYVNIRPTRVIHLAAKVGGIFDNINDPTSYLVDNIMMNTLVAKYARSSGVRRFTGILSTCSYPNKVDHYPMTENMFLQGPPEATSINYAYTKRVLGLQIDSYNKQYNTKYNYLIPCNLYSRKTGDIDKLHFIQALIKKISIAIKQNILRILLSYI